MSNLPAQSRLSFVVATSLLLAGAALGVGACSSSPAPVEPGAAGGPGSTAVASATVSNTVSANTVSANTVSSDTAPAVSGSASALPTATAPASTAVAPAASPSATVAPAASASASAASTKAPGRSYVACGCGCCGGVSPQKQCIYRSKGDDLDKIIAQDQASRKNPRCAVMGCSMGTEYTYCD